jgi:hypothetical protein
MGAHCLTVLPVIAGLAIDEVAGLAGGADRAVPRAPCAGSPRSGGGTRRAFDERAGAAFSASGA